MILPKSDNKLSFPCLSPLGRLRGAKNPRPAPGIWNLKMGENPFGISGNCLHYSDNNIIIFIDNNLIIFCNPTRKIYNFEEIIFVMVYFSNNIKLLRGRKKRTQNEVALALNLKRTTVNALENSISQPTVPQLQVFSKYFGIAIDTLINVDLKQLSEMQFTDLQNGFDVFIRGTNLRVIATTVDSANNDNIEFVNEKAQAGYVTSFADPEYIGQLPVFQLPFLSKEKKYRAFTITGDSMLPIPGGSVVIGEFVQDFLDVKSGQACIVVTRDEGIVFKLVKNEIAEKRSLEMISLNTQFEPYDLAVSEVKEIWKFVCYLNREIPEPESDIQKVMQSVNEMKMELQQLKATMK